MACGNFLRFYVNECFFLHICMCAHVSMCPWTSEEGVGSPGTGVTDGCEPPCICRELNGGPLQQQLSHLTRPADGIFNLPFLMDKDPFYMASEVIIFEIA